MRSQQQSVIVKEDLSRHSKEARQELRNFVRQARKSNPGATFTMREDEDSIMVEGRKYVWDEAEKRVRELQACPPR